MSNTTPFINRSYGRSLLVMALLLIMALVLASCGGGDGGDDGEANTDPSVSPTPELTDVDMDGGPGVLVWVGDGRAPGDQPLATPGELAIIEPDGDYNTIMTLRPNTTRVYACGEQATSRNYRYFAFYVGNDHGSLYLADGDERLYEVDRIDALGCIGGNALQFSPNSERFAYIDFNDNAQTDPIAQGNMLVRETDDDQDELFTFDNVAAFDINDENVAYVGVFSDYTEAALTIWNDGDTDEIGTFFADDGCTFTGAQVALMAGTGVSVLLGERCSGSGTQWSVHTGDITGGGVARVLRGDATGAFFSESRTAALFASHEGEVIAYAIPNGIARNLVNIRTATVTDPEDSDDITESAVMPRLTSRLYNPEDQTSPVVSPNGRWLTIVSNDINNDVAVNIFDLNDPDNPPLILNPVARGDVVSSVAYTPDGNTLLFIAGGTDGADNSLFSVALETAEDNRLERGRYAEVVPAADGLFALISEWRVVTDPREPSYLNLVIMDLNDTDEVDTLFEGAEIVDDRVTNQRFIYPLGWRG